MRKDNTIDAFFALVRAGLFPVHGEGFRVNESLFQDVEWEKIYQLAQEQSVLGLVLAGLEQYKNLNANLDVNQKLLLQWIGEVQMIELRNKAMNVYIADLIEEMRSVGIYTLLVKGQGLAQCYNRPNWRSSGDVDLLLSKDNYEKAKAFILPKGVLTEPEEAGKKHLAMQVGQWAVELHGTLRVGLSKRVDRMLDKVQHDIFYGGQVRSVALDVNDNLNDNGTTKSFKSVQVFLPAANEDVVYVFAHILQHFYKGGIGLRQVCDWCRLLYTYRDSLNYELLESRIKRAGLMSEWKAFYNLASRYLGMPDFGLGLTDVESAMPRQSSNKFGSAHGSIAELTVHDSRYDKKADKICEFILEVGNFGHNRDNSYFQKHSYFIQKCISAWRRVKDLCRHATIFPVNSVRFFFGIMHNGIVSAVRGE